MKYYLVINDEDMIISEDFFLISAKNFAGLTEDCSNSIANPLEFPQSFTKPTKSSGKI